MESPERRRLVFLLPEYKPNTIFPLDPKENTPEDNKRILNEHIGRDSTFFIETDKTDRIISPSELKLVEKMSQEKREDFLSEALVQMRRAKRIFLKSAVMFSNN